MRHFATTVLLANILASPVQAQNPVTTDIPVSTQLSIDQLERLATINCNDESQQNENDCRKGLGLLARTGPMTRSSLTVHRELDAELVSPAITALGTRIAAVTGCVAAPLPGGRIIAMGCDGMPAEKRFFQIAVSRVWTGSTLTASLSWLERNAGSVAERDRVALAVKELLRFQGAETVTDKALERFFGDADTSQITFGPGMTPILQIAVITDQNKHRRRALSVTTPSLPALNKEN